MNAISIPDSRIPLQLIRLACDLPHDFDQKLMKFAEMNARILDHCDRDGDFEHKTYNDRCIVSNTLDEAISEVKTQNMGRACQLLDEAFELLQKLEAA